MDKQYYGHEMKSVSKELFYEVIYKFSLDVHPFPVSSYDPKFGYTMEWTFQGYRTLFGISDGGTTFEESRYWMSQESYQKFIDKDGQIKETEPVSTGENKVLPDFSAQK